MKKQRRIIIKRWDDMNNRLVARVFMASRHFVSVKQYESPIMMKNIHACKGHMFQSKHEEMSFGRTFIKDLANIANITSDLQDMPYE